MQRLQECEVHQQSEGGGLRAASTLLPWLPSLGWRVGADTKVTRRPHRLNSSCLESCVLQAGPEMERGTRRPLLRWLVTAGRSGDWDTSYKMTWTISDPSRTCCPLHCTPGHPRVENVGGLGSSKPKAKLESPWSWVWPMRAEVSEAKEVPGSAGSWRLSPAGILPVALCARLQNEERAEAAVVWLTQFPLHSGLVAIKSPSYCQVSWLSSDSH